jgi:hypothetical protein
MRADLAVEQRRAVTWAQEGATVDCESVPTQYLSSGVRFARGLLIATALSIPIWLAVILFVL